jgi:hypothetical protein
MPTTNEESSTQTQEAYDPAYKAALDSRREELRAIPEDNILWDLRLAGGRASTVAEGTAKKLQPFRPALVARFGEEAGVLVDRLATTAHAARQADLEYSLAQPADDLSPLAEEVSDVYGMLMADATSFAKRKLIDGATLDKAREIKGYQALSESTLKLVAILRENWAALEGRGILTKHDLDRAEHLVRVLTTALAYRDENVDLVPARELRARALSELAREYGELRRMMLFLRHYQGDTDEIIPSLWALRGSSRRTDRTAVPSVEPNTGGEPTGDEPVVPTPGDDNPPFTP